MEAEVFLFVGIIAVCIFSLILNPDFWQGFRNAKFIDQLMEEEHQHDLQKALEKEEAGNEK